MTGGRTPRSWSRWVARPTCTSWSTSRRRPTTFSASNSCRHHHGPRTCWPSRSWAARPSPQRAISARGPGAIRPSPSTQTVSFFFLLSLARANLMLPTEDRKHCYCVAHTALINCYSKRWKRRFALIRSVLWHASCSWILFSSLCECDLGEKFDICERWLPGHWRRTANWERYGSII